MTPQHLSDEAVAAFADGVLRGHARERAARHLEGCAECREAVRVQREAAAAVRAAPPPALPGDLLAKLRTVPLTTPLPSPPAAVAPDGSALFSTFAPMAALAPEPPSPGSKHRMRTFFTTAALVGAAGAVVAAATTHDHPATSTGHPAYPVTQLSPAGSAPGSAIEPVSVFRGPRP